jgi:PAS domain S-box-containing protein
MGVLEGIHGVAMLGNTMVLLHTLACLVGSSCFALIWLPGSAYRSDALKPGHIAWLVAAGSALLGTVVLLFGEEGMPPMLRNGEFTHLAVAINILAGLLFIAAGGRFLLDFHRSGKLESGLFASMALLFGLPGLMFKYSEPWDEVWWAWHLLRTAAYLLALGLVIREHQRIVSDLKVSLAEGKRAEEALRESEGRFRAIMEQSPEAIFLIDAETGGILEANSAFQELLGYSLEEIVGLPIFDLVSADRGIMDRRFQETVQTGKPTFDERQYRKKDGSLTDVWVSRKVVFYAGKEVMCVILHDLTERKRAEAEREKLIGELQEALGNIKTLSGLIPICAQCKKIRDDKGYWQQVEVYVRDHSEAKFSHGLCPECTKLLFPELQEKRKGGNPP